HNKFVAMGAAEANLIPMVDRGSWNQVVAIGQGLQGAKGVLPPGNSGRLTAAELAAMTAPGGEEPAHLTNQLRLYTSFQYAPLPVTAAEVAEVAVATTTLVVPRALLGTPGILP
ncbi:MAG TPA: hypothetical protein VNZ52_09265, partial [Candidatus Thermoplasmatota archaeon]|nr:hypothetical protein [Candidatus Thermoplasmatota archaeon]